MVQINTVPYTIVYQPPGNMSTASFSAMTTYGTQFSLGSSNEVSNSWTTEQSSTTQFSMKEALTFGFSANDSDTWNQATTETWGTTNGITNTGSSNVAFGLTLPIPANNSLVPGGTVCVETTNCSALYLYSRSALSKAQPYWHDTFYLEVNPQFGVWVLGSGGDRWVMYASVPGLADVEVGQLDACAHAYPWYGRNGCTIQYSDDFLTGANGQSPQWAGQAGKINLTADEAANLLALDPFYADGQAAKPDANRAVNFGGGGYNYGMSQGTDPRPVMVNLNNTQFSQTGANAQATSSFSVTTVWGSSSQVGGTIDVSGGGASGSGGITAGSGFKDTEGTTVKATFQNSTAVSKNVVTSISATLNDVDITLGGCKPDPCHNPFQYRPVVNIYFDKVFGTYMFQDPNAPPPSPSTCCIIFVNSLVRQEMKHPRFSDVPASDPAVGAIGLMASINVLPGNADRTFHPKDAFTREQLATALSVALNLPNLEVTPHPTNFSDVTASHPAAGAIAAVTGRNLIPVASATKFQPLDAVTRQDFSVALTKAFHLQGQGPAFMEASGLPAATQQAISAVLSKGYMTLSNGAFQPNGALSRAEAAQSLFLAIRDYAANGTPHPTF
jgi:hypothetical protein